MVKIENLNGVRVSPITAIKGKDYVGTIEIDVLVIKDKLLPESLTKVTSGNKELIVHQGYTYTLKEDNVSADFKIPAANIVGDVSIQLSLIPRPEPEPTDPHVVTQQEFIDAVTFKDAHYLQTMETIYDELSEPEYHYKKEMSPSVYYDLGSKDPITITNEEDYHEKYCRKNEKPITYDRCKRSNPTGDFDFYTNVESKHFATPQTFGIAGDAYILENLIKTELGLTYDSFNYIKEESKYKAKFNDFEGDSGYITLKFEGKKLVNYELTIDNDANIIGLFAYLEKTPKYPTQPAEF